METPFVRVQRAGFASQAGGRGCGALTLLRLRSANLSQGRFVKFIVSFHSVKKTNHTGSWVLEAGETAGDPA